MIWNGYYASCTHFSATIKSEYFSPFIFAMMIPRTPRFDSVVYVSRAIPSPTNTSSASLQVSQSGPRTSRSM